MASKVKKKPNEYFDIIWILKVMGHILALIRVPSTIKLTYLKYY
jgi:hypothetical protein